MTILLTGNKGFIGSYLEPKLKELGHAVYGVDKKSSKKQDLRYPWKSGFFKRLSEKKIDLIIHLAAVSMVRVSVDNPDVALENIQTTFNVLEFARKNKIKKIIFSSSREVFGNQEDFILKEDQSRSWLVESPYAASKLTGEDLMAAYKKCFGINYVTVRLSNVFGLNDPNDRFIVRLFQGLPNNKPFEVYGAEKQMDFTFIDDCVNGFMAVVDNFSKLTRNKIPIYNIAYGKSEKLLDVAEYLKKLFKSKSKIKVTKNLTGEVVKYQADISKFQKATKWKPQFSVYDGLNDMYEKTRNQ